MLKSLLDSDINSKENKKDNLLALLSEINFFPRYKGKIINILFEDNTEIKLNISAPDDTQIKDLLVIFYIRLQMHGLENKIKIYEMKDYTFLFNSQKISLNDETSILDFGMKHKVNKIVFFKSNSTIGG